MRYVSDASVLISLLVNDQFTAHARVFISEVSLKGDNVFVPNFCQVECVNAIWKYVRFQGLTQLQGEQAIGVLIALPLEIVPVADLYVRALQIGLTHQIAIYDSIYIALAEQTHCTLITADAKQLRVALAEKVLARSVMSFQL